MTLRTHEELYAELKKEPHGRLAKIAADFVMDIRHERQRILELEQERDVVKAEALQWRIKFESMRDINDANLESYNNCAIEARALKEQVVRLTAALDGLCIRHCDGTEEEYWAEWDTAYAVRASKEEKA